MTSHQQPQPEELSTSERLKMTGGAVAQGIRYTLTGEHETEGKAALRADLADVERIIANWPGPQQNVAHQLLELTHLITMFDGSILVDRTRGEVAARCDSEAANVLGLNMVHELVTGKRTVQEARHTSEQNTVAYNAGRAAPYAERLLFEVPQGGTEDLDEGHLAGSVLQQAVGKLKDALTPGGGRRPATVAPPAAQPPEPDQRTSRRPAGLPPDEPWSPAANC